MVVNFHELKDIACDVVVACSLAHSILPPWDFLNDFPRAQKAYKVLIYLVGWIAINARSTVYKSISIENPDSLNVTKVSGV